MGGLLQLTYEETEGVLHLASGQRRMCATFGM